MSDFLAAVGDGLAAIAPTLASAFGGPLAGLAVTSLEKVLGVGGSGSTATSPSAALTQALSAAMMNPDQVLALKKADNEFKEFCLTNNLQWAQMDASDRASARERQVALKDTFPNHVAIFILGAFVMVVLFQCALIFLVPAFKLVVPTELYRVLDTATGLLASPSLSIVSYYFGSSAASRAKDDTIAASIKNGNGAK